MDIHDRIAVAEKRVETATEQFVNSAKATPEQRKAYDAELSEAIEELKQLRGRAVREALDNPR